MACCISSRHCLLPTTTIALTSFALTLPSSFTTYLLSAALPPYLFGRYSAARTLPGSHTGQKNPTSSTLCLLHTAHTLHPRCTHTMDNTWDISLHGHAAPHPKTT